MQRYGRKFAHYFLCLPTVLGWLAIFVAGSVPLLLVGRFLTGKLGLKVAKARGGRGLASREGEPKAVIPEPASSCQIGAGSGLQNLSTSSEPKSKIPEPKPRARGAFPSPRRDSLAR